MSEKKTFELESMTLQDLDIDELEQRLEMSPGSPGFWCGCGGDSCSDTCGTKAEVPCETVNIVVCPDQAVCKVA